jgi:hypothetical protein
VIELSALTTIRRDCDFPKISALIVKGPAATAVTNPEVETIAPELLEERQVASNVESFALWSLKIAIAENCCGCSVISVDTAGVIMTIRRKGQVCFSARSEGALHHRLK